MQSVESTGHPRDTTADPTIQRELALRACGEQIDFFRRSARRSHWLDAASQAVTIIISATIPVILLAGDGDTPSWLSAGMGSDLLAAALSAIVAIASGLAGAFHWREEWIRHAFFAQQLVSERVQFLAGAGDYGEARSDDRAIDLFVTRTEELRLAEAGQWRKRAMQHTRTAPPDNE